MIPRGEKWRSLVYAFVILGSEIQFLGPVVYCASDEICSSWWAVRYYVPVRQIPSCPIFTNFPISIVTGASVVNRACGVVVAYVVRVYVVLGSNPSSPPSFFMSFSRVLFALLYGFKSEVTLSHENC
jgi:hypothetical protein